MSVNSRFLKLCYCKQSPRNYRAGLDLFFYCNSHTIFASSPNLNCAFSVLSIMPPKQQWFYAVRKGKVPGIYTTWPECETQVKGFHGPQFKKFATEEEAQAFIDAAPGAKKASSASAKEDGKAAKRLSDATGDDEGKEKKAKPDTSEGDFTGSKFEDKDASTVYTDGGCFNNGKLGACAGIGVFWGDDDPSNVSEKLDGRQTNNRAEILAAARALKIAKEKGIKNLILHTDSQFLINGITKWVSGWKKKGWKNATGETVKNKEDFEALDSETEGINVKWVHVKGHSGNDSNDKADKLARLGAGLKVKT